MSAKHLLEENTMTKQIGNETVEKIKKLLKQKIEQTSPP